MRFVLLALVACGGSSTPEQPRSGPAASTTAAPAPGDVVVANVNGRPVWGSCVTAQSRGKPKQAALDECIAFELMAQEAEARGLASDPLVVDETRTALVDRLVETGFEQRFESPADLQQVLDAHIERNKARLVRPEARASTYVRIEVPKHADEARGKVLADQLVAKLANQEGLHPRHLVDEARALFGDKLMTETVVFYARESLDKAYADALFAIPEAGRIAPQAVRTPWGWDVILLDGILPAKTYTREEAAAEAFPEIRRQYFTHWVNQIIRSLGVKITVDPKQLDEADA